jgi:Fe-Mn family superoxide dismutase
MFTLPGLSYDYNALGKYISADIMKLHHDKHHQTYVDKLNVALDKAPEFKEKTIEELITDLDAVPQEIRTAVRNHGGGHYNHTLFWQFLSPEGGNEPTGELGDALKAKYGSYQAFMEQFESAALGVFGSGWAWLQPDLSIVTTPNQDSPIMNGQAAPLLGLDVWEHAYYLDYTYNRADYVSAWWNVANWQVAAERYANA